MTEKKRKPRREKEKEIINEFLKHLELAKDCKIEREVLVGVKEVDKELKHSNNKEDFKKYAEQVYKRGTSKKIDIVIECDNEIWLIEGKQRLSAHALGQILVYEHLYLENPKNKEKKKEIKLGICCRYDDPLVTDVCRKYHVKVFIV